MIKLRDILNEIGDGSAKGYEFKVTSSSDKGSTYKFTTASKLVYVVELFITIKDEVKQLEVEFKVEGGEFKDITNRGELFNIMITVVNVIKDKIAVIDKEGINDVDVIAFTPEKADDTDNRRADIYKMYIKKQMPGATVEERSGEFFITLPKK